MVRPTAWPQTNSALNEPWTCASGLSARMKQGPVRKTQTARTLQFADALADRQQLDVVAQFGSESDIGLVQPINALASRGLIRQASAECQGGKDGKFLGRVVSRYVERGIGLGVAFLLGFAERVLVRSVLLGHGRQDVVGGSVQDAIHRFNLVCHEAKLNGRDDRESHRHRLLRRRSIPHGHVPAQTIAGRAQPARSYWL